MNKKFVAILFFQFTVIAAVFALTPKRLDIYLKNELSAPFAVHCEFRHKANNEIPDFPARWIQSLADKKVICGSYVDEGKTTYKSDTTVHLIWLTPNALLVSDAFSEILTTLDAIPLEQKLKELFKTLVITDADGEVLLTLDDFSKAKVEVGPSGRSYTIIIGEYLYQ